MTTETEKPVKLTLDSFYKQLKMEVNRLFIDRKCVLCRDRYHSAYHVKMACLVISFVLFTVYLMNSVQNLLYFFIFFGALYSFIRFLKIVAEYAEYCARIEAHPESKQSGNYLT